MATQMAGMLGASDDAREKMIADASVPKHSTPNPPATPSKSRRRRTRSGSRFTAYVEGAIDRWRRAIAKG